MDSPLLICGAFAAGAGFTALLVVLLKRQHVITVSPEVTVTPPTVVLPDSLRVILQQPPPPPAPKDRATVWQEVYNRTFGDSNDYSSTSAQRMAMELSRDAANAAVDIAFPPSP